MAATSCLSSTASRDATVASTNQLSDSGADTKEKYVATVDPGQEVDASQQSKIGEDDFPDGGLRAWLIVCGAMCNTFSTSPMHESDFWTERSSKLHCLRDLRFLPTSTRNYLIALCFCIRFGYVNSWGIFQNYYTETILRTSSPSTIAWIGSIQYSLVFFPGLIAGRLFDLGYFHTVFLTSSAVLIIATFLIAQCTQYWHFLLCQGFLVGMGCGGIYGPTTAVIAHWFKKRRGLAMGVVTMGSSLGGTILPIAAKNLIPRVGFQWTMRIFGFILVATLGASNLLLKRRLPPRKVAGGLLNLAAFKSGPYSVYCASAFVMFLGIYTMLTYVGVSAIGVGVSSSFAFYFIAIANASSLFGRYAAGSVADRIGSMNIMIPFTVWVGILTYAWPFAKTKAALIALTVLYGFASGAYVSLVTNPIMEMGGTGDVGRRTGMFMSILAMGALAGPPISGAINSATGNFMAVGYYAGSTVMVGVGLLCVSRYLVLRRLWGKI